MQNFLVIGVFLALGVVARHALALPERTPIYINRFIINAALPAVILLQLPRLQVSGAALLPILAPWLFIPLSMVVIHVAARRLQFSREVTGALYLLAPLGNTSYLGYPMTQAFYGGDAMPYAIVFDQLGSFLALALYAPIVIARFASSDQPSVAVIVARVFRFPPFLALCLALLFLRSTTLPPVAVTVLTLLGKSMAPLAMFIVGLQLSLRLSDSIRQPLALSLALKLVGLPLFVLLLAGLSGASGLSARVSVFEGAMPTMVTAAIMAMAAGMAPRLCSAAIGLGLCVSLLTLPVWYCLGQWLL